VQQGIYSKCLILISFVGIQRDRTQ
nr:ORF 1 C term [Drosophila sp. (in: flies)]